MTLALLLAWGCTAPQDPLDSGPVDTGASADTAATDTGPDEPDNVYRTRVRPLLAPCVQCHGGELTESELDLTDPLALVGAPAEQSELALIEPGHALQSYLWHKVNGSQTIAGGLGGTMPVGWVVTDEQIDALGWWIDQGAVDR